MLKRIGLACLVVVAATAAVANKIDDCRQGRNSEASVRACSEVIAGAGYSADEKALAYQRRGNARLDAGAGAQAVADFNEAIRLRPNEAAAYADRGRARLSVQDVSGAIADYTDALRLAPATASSYVGRGHANFLKGDTTSAIADFTEALRLSPTSPSILNRRGLAYRRSGDLARAIDDYTAAIKLNPVYALAYNNRGYVYESQGRKDDALLDFQTALLLDPSLIGARDGLVRLGVPPTFFAETEQRVQDGKALAERSCSPCHAVGSTGASPNQRAPKFRDLHARHSSLALREPLSRGIAAPHDEMPKFALSGPEIDTIVAYINSLSAASAGSPKAKREARVAEAVDIGDPAKGLAYAQRVCSTCHNVLRRDEASPNPRAPPFLKVASTPGMTGTALTVWSRSVHPTMPNLVIEPTDMDNLIAYILSLRNGR